MDVVDEGFVILEKSEYEAESLESKTNPHEKKETITEEVGEEEEEKEGQEECTIATKKPPTLARYMSSFWSSKSSPPSSPGSSSLSSSSSSLCTSPPRAKKKLFSFSLSSWVSSSSTGSSISSSYSSGFSFRRQASSPGRSECNRINFSWFEGLENRRTREWDARVDMYVTLRAAIAELDGLFGESETKEGVSSQDQADDGEAKNRVDKNRKQSTQDGEGRPERRESLAMMMERSRAEIECDIPRTYNGLPFFCLQETRDRLLALLLRVSKQYPDIRYVPGMNYVLAQLMLHSRDDDEAFSFFRRIMDEPAFNLHGLYQSGFPVLENCIRILHEVLLLFNPVLMAKLSELGLGLMDFTLDWFLTLFAYSMPFETLVEVWDLFFESGWQALFRVSVILLQDVSQEIVADSSPGAVLVMLRAAPTYPPDELVSSARTLEIPAALQKRMAKVSLVQ